MFTPEPRLEPPEPVVFAECGCCGGEIYEGETFFDIDGEYIHEDCLHDFADEYFADRKREAVIERRRIAV